MTTPIQAIIPSPAKPKRSTKTELNELRAENERLRAQLGKAQEVLLKMQDKILSLRNERAAILQWIRWLRGHVNAGDIFNQPDYVAETAWKDPPKSWREGGEGGVVHHPETTVKRTDSNSIVLLP